MGMYSSPNDRNALADMTHPNSIVVSAKWLRAHLICEFNHWDVCLDGLAEHDGDKWFCKIAKEDAAYDHCLPLEYELHRVAWDEECEEYLADYRVAYKHWFWENGKRPYSYGGWALGWFREKWNGRNPIKERAMVTA
jgi:hypothetical protein